VIRKTTLPVLANPAQRVERALDQPAGCPPLSVLAQGCQKVCIVVCDVTRPVPNGLILRPMIERLTRAGVPLDGIVILIATGLHRAGDALELAEVVGDPWVVDHVRVLWHNAFDPEGLVNLGKTPSLATPVWINRHLVEADLRLVTGLVEPHFMAGWSGGRKVVAPGVAGQETIRTFHSARFMEHPAATQCNLVGNPLHEEQLAIASQVGPIYALNTVIDEQRQLSFVNFGEVVHSHLAAVEFAAAHACVAVPRRFSTVLTSAAGYPLDKTYYQTVKGMVAPLDILQPGGTIIVASECSEGFGSPAYRAAQTRLAEMGPEGFLASLLAKQLGEVDEWQTEMQLKPMRVGHIQLYTTGLNQADRRLTGVEVIDSVEQAIVDSIARSGDQAVAVIPEGPYTIPQLASSQSGHRLANSDQNHQVEQ